MNIPEKYKYLEKFLEEPFGRQARLCSGKYAIHGISTQHEAPIIAGIYLLNGDIDKYETMREIAYKRVKHLAAYELLMFVMINDMGIELATEFWKNRNVRTTSRLYETLKVVDEKYAIMILSSDKLYRELTVDIEGRDSVKLISECDPLMKHGKNYPKFVKFCMEAFKRYDLDGLIPDDAKEIFLF
jgi:hypothetical protein